MAQIVVFAIGVWLVAPSGQLLWGPLLVLIGGVRRGAAAEQAGERMDQPVPAAVRRAGPVSRKTVQPSIGTAPRER